MSVSGRTVDGLDPTTLDIDLRDRTLAAKDHPYDETPQGPDEDLRRRWFRRQLTGPTLILAADLTVLAGYAVAAPDWWRMLASFWVTTVAAFLLAKLYRPRLHVALLDDLPTMVKSMLASAVLVVAYGHYRDSGLIEVVRRHRLGFVSMFVIPRLFEVGRASALQDHIGAIPVQRPRVVAMTGPTWVVKRGFDVVASALAALALSPVLVAVALAVRWELGPGVIFRQVRVGRDGREFEVFKFRSMRPADPGESNVQWSIAQDARVGRVGRFIRRTSLDELPQLFNILRGDMTFVGPRPERPHFVAMFGADLPHYEHRHRVPVGLTGLAQVSGLRGDTSIDDRARFDNYYIENWSLWLDCKVILRTVRHVLGSTGS